MSKAKVIITIEENKLIMKTFFDTYIYRVSINKRPSFLNHSEASL